MSQDEVIEKYFCNSCGQRTKHFVRASHEITKHDDSDGTSLTREMKIIECCGCEHLAFSKRSHFSEHIDFDNHPVTGEQRMIPLWDEAIFPPVTYRSPPPWFEDLPDPTLRQISEEIYKSLQTESHYLAVFGSRTLMDRLIVLTVGDKGNFAKGLQALQDDGKISQHERDIVEPIIQAGHAAAHRGWAPTKAQLKTILDTVEGLIHRLLVLPKLAEELDEAVPSRHGKEQPAVGSSVTISDKLKNAPPAIRSLYSELEKRLSSFGKDVSAHRQKHYVAFKRNRNFASIQVYNQKKVVRIYLNLDPDTVDLNRAGLRDVRQIGHYGTGDLELTLKTKKDLDSFSDLLQLSYDVS